MRHDQAFSSTFLRITLHRLCDLYYPKLDHVMKALTKEQLWLCAEGQDHSIGSIVLHVCEHIRRNEIRLTERNPVLPAAFERYFPDETLAPEDLIRLFGERLEEWKQIMLRFIRGDEPFEIEHLHNLYHLTEHTGYHLGQIIDRTQTLTGHIFEFVKHGLNEKHLRDTIDAAER